MSSNRALSHKTSKGELDLKDPDLMQEDKNLSKKRVKGTMAVCSMELNHMMKMISLKETRILSWHSINQKIE